MMDAQIYFKKTKLTGTANTKNGDIVVDGQTIICATA